MKPGRNDPCPCGSGNKYKKCCAAKFENRHPQQNLPAYKAAPTTAEYNQLVALFNAGRHVELENLARLMIAQYPDSGFVWNILAASFKAQGKEVLPALQKAANFLPNDAEVQCNLGVVLQDLGQLDAAVASYRRALKIKPDCAEAYNNLGLALQALGRLDDAMESYHWALKIKPAYAEAHNNLGNVLIDLGRLDDAVASYQRALKIKPDYAKAHCNLGNALKDLGLFDAASQSYRVALKIKPDLAEAHNNLGNALSDLGLFDDAAASCRRAIQIKPDYAKAHFNLGNALKDLGLFEDAVESFLRALEIKPDFVEVYINLGNALHNLGRLDDALTSCRTALTLKPDYVTAHGNLLFALNYHPDLSAEQIYREYQEFDAQRCFPLRSTWREHNNDRNRDRRLRIGYVSPDFKNHSCRFFLEPLLAHHDKSRVEVYAYAELLKEDDLTARYKSYVEHWIPTKGMSDEALAQRIRSDGIDILVELAGHTAGNRLLTFARKPAPVSVSWLGYGYTSGLSAIDYYLTDEACTPPGSERLFAELPWRIDTPALTYRPPADMGEVGELPAQQRGYVTFGTLTRSIRINHRTIRVWSAILNALPNSRLVVDSPTFKDAAMQEKLASQFAEHRISRDRLEIGCHSPPWDTLRGIDIGLDCFPHNSGTTLFESLYMGVPFITLAGRPSAGRLGSSILQGLGRPEWIAEDEDGYIARAVDLASDIRRLSKIRSLLRETMENSPLRDEEGFTRKIEDAYSRMWAKWCNPSA